MKHAKKPVPARRHCGLSGCDRTFVVPPTGRPKRYCCDLHRALASRKRQREERATAYNAAPEDAGGVPGPLMTRVPRRGASEGAVVSKSDGAVHQKGKGTGFVRYSVDAVIHIEEEAPIK